MWLELINYASKWWEAASSLITLHPVSTISIISTFGAVVLVIIWRRRKGSKKISKESDESQSSISRDTAKFENKKLIQIQKQIVIQKELLESEEKKEDEHTGLKQRCIGGRVNDPFLFSKLGNSLKENENTVKKESRNSNRPVTTTLTPAVRSRNVEEKKDYNELNNIEKENYPLDDKD